MRGRVVAVVIAVVICVTGAWLLRKTDCARLSPEPGSASAKNWPSILEAAPLRKDKHVHWLDLGGGSRPRVVAIHPNGHLAALQTSCETVVYDLRSGRRLHAWLLPTTVVQFSSEGQRLLTRRKEEFTLWDAERFDQVHRFAEKREAWSKDMPSEQMAAMRRHSLVAALNDDGDLVAISNCRQLFAQERPEALLLYSDSGEFRYALSIPENATIRSAQFLRDNRLLMSYSNVENDTRGFRHVLWDAASGKMIRELPRGETARASVNGRYLASARLPGRWQNTDPSKTPTTLSLWDVKTGNLLHTIEPSARIRDFAFRPDGRRVLAALDNRLIEWGVESGATEYDSAKSERPYANVAYSPDGKRRFAFIEIPNGMDDDVDHHLLAWEVATGQSLPIADFAFNSYNGTERLFFYRDGDHFIDLAASFAIRDVKTGKELQTAPAYRIPRHEAAIMPDGEKLLTGSLLTDLASGKQRRWSLTGARHEFINAGRVLFSGNHSGVFLTDVPSGTTFWRYRLQSGYMPADVAPSSDGERTVVAYRFGSKQSESRLLVINPRKPDEPLIISEYASAVAVSPNHRRFIAASHAGIHERMTDSGAQLAELWTPPGRVLFVNYSPDGTRVIAGGAIGHVDNRDPLDADDDGWAAVLDTDTKQAIMLTGHSAPVTTGKFSPDGQRCVTGSMDRTIRLWSSSQGEGVHVFRGHLGTVNRVAYGPKGERILSAADDGSALWNIAGNVDLGKQPGLVARTFEQVASINAWNGAVGQPRKGSLFPSSDRTSKLAHPAKGTAEWNVIKLGDVTRHSNIPHNWLTIAGSTRQVAADKHIAQPDALPGYKYHGESRDGQRHIYSSRQKQEILATDASGEVLSTWKGQLRNNEVAISASGNEVAIARELQSSTRPSKRGLYEVTVYDVQSGESLRAFDDIESWYIHSLKIDPREETILLQINNSDLELRDFQSGKRLAELKSGPAGAGLQSAYTPDGRFVVTSKYPDPVIHVRDPKTLEDVKPLENHLPVRWFRLTPDGRHILAGQPFVEYRPLVTKWEIETGQRLWSRVGPASAEGEFSDSGQYYLAKSGWYLWTLWDITSGNLCCVVVCQSRYTRDNCHPVFGDDERSLHLGSRCGTQLWPSDS